MSKTQNVLQRVIFYHMPIDLDRLYNVSPTCLTRSAVPAVSTRMSVFTYSTDETLASGGVTSLGTSAGEDARTLTVRPSGEPTTGSYNNAVIILLHK